MIDYTGLRILLAQKNLKFKYLHSELGIHPTVIAKLNKDEYVSLEIIERICLHFDIGIENILKINP